MEGTDTIEVDTTTKITGVQFEAVTEIPITIDLTMKNDPGTKMSTSTEADRSQITNLEEGIEEEAVLLLEETFVAEKGAEEAVESSVLEAGVK